MEELLEAEIEGVSGAYLIRSTELTTIYPVEDYYDPYGEELGHIPYTPAFFCALGWRDRAQNSCFEELWV